MTGSKKSDYSEQRCMTILQLWCSDYDIRCEVYEDLGFLTSIFVFANQVGSEVLRSSHNWPVQFRCCLVLLRFELEASTEVKLGKISSSWQKQHRSQQIQCWCEKCPSECESQRYQNNSELEQFHLQYPYHCNFCIICFLFCFCVCKIAIWSQTGSVSLTASSVMCEGVGGRSIVKFGGPEL